MRFSLLSSLVFLLFPFTAKSLGLGDISISSSLNSPLEAKIQLESATSQDLESLDIKLASDKDFLRSNIDKIDLLKRIKFKLIENNGSPYIQVTTKSILREPFVNFLIDIQWYSGRILREYTLFVDPPETMNIDVNKGTAKSPVENAPGKQTAPDKNLPPSLTYGPTKDNDTLWFVATRMHQNTGVSVAQLMMALQRENPQAFNNENINGLMSGYTLKISDSSILSNLSKKDARILVEKQHELWRQITDKNRKEAGDYELASSSSGKTANEPAKIVEKKSKLKLLSPDVIDNNQHSLAVNVKSNRSSITIAKIEAKLALYEERIQSQTQENEELRKHITELEKLLEKNESLVNLKDENLSIIQERNKLEQETAVKESIEESKSEIIDENETTEETENGNIVKNAEDASVTEEDAATEEDVIAEEVTKEDTAVKEENAAIKEEVVVAEKIVEDKNKTIVSKPLTPSTPNIIPVAKQESTLDFILGYVNGIYKNYFNELLIAAGSFFLLLLVSMFSRRSKKNTQGDFQESILNNTSIAEGDYTDTTDERDPLDTSDMGESTGLEDETSFLSDFSSSELDGLQPDDTDSDPLSEADVFIVYGRYDQAEEMLKGVINKQPDRLDYQMKLLEVYHGDTRKNEFKQQAGIIKKLILASGISLDGSEEWDKVLDLSGAFNMKSVLTSTDAIKENADEMIDELETTTEDSNVELADDEIDVDDLERQLNEFEAMLEGDLDDDFNTEDEALSSESQVESPEVSLDMDLPELDDTPHAENAGKIEDEDSLNSQNDSVDTEELDLEIDLDDISNIGEDSLSEAADTVAEELDLEIELDEVSIEDSSLDKIEELEEIALDEVSVDLDNIDESIGIDLDDLSSDTTSQDTEGSNEELAIKESNNPDFEVDIDNLELDLDDLAEELEDSKQLEDAIEVEDSLELDDALGDMEFDLDDLDSSLDSLDSDNDKELNLDDLTDELNDISNDLTIDGDIPELDSIGSKLDLAKARIEMGDEESKNAAIKALEIVVKEGDEQQRADAEKLLELTR